MGFDDFVNHFCKHKLYLYRQKQIAQVKAVLADLPIRSFVRLLVVVLQDCNDQSEFKYLTMNKVAMVFSTTFQDFSYNLTDLQYLGSTLALSDLVLNLHRTGLLNQGVHLEPDQKKETFNIVLCILGGLFAEAIHLRPVYALQFMLRVSFLQQAFINYFPLNFAKLYAYLQLDQDIEDSQVAHRIVAALRSAVDLNRPMDGISLRVFAESKRNDISTLMGRYYTEKNDSVKGKYPEIRNFALVAENSVKRKNQKIQRYVNTMQSVAVISQAAKEKA